MTETPAPDAATPDDYDVVLLVERALGADDAARLRSLHEGLDEPVVYHVLLPVDDAAAGVEAALGGLSSPDVLAAPVPRTPALAPDDVAVLQQADQERAAHDLATTLEVLRAAGATADGSLTTDAPIEALAAEIRRVDGREAIVLTRPHVVAEFFHVDWSAQARRHLDVPVLHLLEGESFDDQAGEGEGASLI